ncbi:hypothetical protein, partial [Glycomyces tenuis]
LAYRLGKAAQWDRTSSADRAELARFMAELRAAGPGHWSEPGPPSSLLEVEGVIRGLRGERHLMGE